MSLLLADSSQYAFTCTGSCVRTGSGRKQNACPTVGGKQDPTAPVNTVFELFVPWGLLKDVSVKDRVCDCDPTREIQAATAPKGTSFRCRDLSSQATRLASPPMRPLTIKYVTVS